MSALLTVLGWWCFVSAMFSVGLVVTISSRASIAATDILFSLAGIGLLFLLLARMSA